MQGVRIESALNALSDTDAKIDSIAVECGFGSGSDFCRAFKSLKGCTPSEWRRQLPHPPNEIESCVAGNTEASPQRA
jgi:AraC-like DNA-binding protein